MHSRRIKRRDESLNPRVAAELEEALQKLERAKQNLRDKARTVFGEQASDKQEFLSLDVYQYQLLHEPPNK